MFHKIRLKSVLKHSAVNAIAVMKLSKMLHKAMFRRHLAILCYHAIVSSRLEVDDWCFLEEISFRQQMNYLQRNFTVLHLSKALDQLLSGKIHEPTAVITFDDGYQNNYDLAFPILREMNLPATIFLTTGLLNTSDTLWFCRLHHAVTHTTKSSLEWAGCSYDLTTTDIRAKTLFVLYTKLKKLPHSKLLYENRKIILKLGLDADLPMELGAPYRMLDHDAIKTMASTGLIEFGAHTHSHAILSLLSREEQIKEISRSVQVVQEVTGRPCECFSYPNGQPQDYDADTIHALKSCKIRGAVTGITGPNDSTTPALELRRYGIGSDTSPAYFQLKVHHMIAQARGLLSSIN